MPFPMTKTNSFSLTSHSDSNIIILKGIKYSAANKLFFCEYELIEVQK